MYVPPLILQISNEAVEHPQFLFLWDFFHLSREFCPTISKKLWKLNSSISAYKSYNKINATFFIMLNKLNLISLLFPYISNSCTCHPLVINCFQLPANESSISLNQRHSTPPASKYTRAHQIMPRVWHVIRHTFLHVHKRSSPCSCSRCPGATTSAGEWPLTPRGSAHKLSTGHLTGVDSGCHGLHHWPNR